MRSLVAACVLVAPTAAAAADWVRVETPNFIVYGEPGERRVREVADEFERFRDALGRVIPGAATPAAVPTVVVVFRSARSFAPYLPRFNGKPVTLGGYFFSSEDMNIVALEDGNRDESLRTIFHEYVHLVINNVSQGMPLWLNEGLAEYYSTFQVEDSGKRALIGRVIPSHLRLLNERRPMPMAELLAVTRDASAYNEGDRRSLFYAQSWALVHMLVSGTKNRASLVSAYARLVAGGTPSPEAWQQVFGDANIIRELTRYVGQDVMTGVIYRFGEDIPQVRSYSSEVSDGDAQALLGDLLRRVAPADETMAHFEKAIAVQPSSARARALYGLALIDADQYDKARPLLLEAAKDKTDWLVQYHVATGLTRIVTATGNPDALLIDTARAALERAQAARPELANPHALGARLDSAEDTNIARALQAILRARAISPGREDYILYESFIRMRRGEFVLARQLLAPLTNTTHASEVRDNALAVLEQVERLEQDAADYVARLEGRKRATEPTASRGVLVPLYRKLDPGEQRVEGLLERIDCSAKGVVLHINVGGTIERFGAPSLGGVQFISHRDDLRGAITCAPRTPPDRVYLIWRGGDSTADRRHVVAVEFLPNPR